MAYIMIILQQIPCYLQSFRWIVCCSKAALGWRSNLHCGIISEKDALIKVADVQHICLVSGIDLFAVSTINIKYQQYQAITEKLSD